MNVIRASLAALVLVSVTYCADQYEDGSHPAAEGRYGGATDHPPDIPRQELNAPHSSQKRQQVAAARRKRALEEYQRTRRDYYQNYQWPASVVPAPAVWQPASYQIQRPYFIPVWGAPGRVPVYFPPQPIYINPNPLDDPRKGYLPPRGYLPPDPRQTTAAPPSVDEGSTVSLINRLGEDDDDRPIWGMDPPAAPQTPATTGRPTRRPALRTTTFPPLQHRPINNSSSGGRPMALRPSQEISPPLSTSPPPQTTTTQRGGRQPSRCVWAIISCCTAASENISYSCFEQLGCTGAFWDASPCESEFARAAIDVASKYYGSK